MSTATTSAKSASALPHSIAAILNEPTTAPPPAVIGIDFGTSFSSVAVFEDGKVILIPTDQGQLRIPSCVAFTDKGFLRGQAAQDLLQTDPKNVLFGVKRVLGLKREVVKSLNLVKHWPFPVINDVWQRLKVQAKDKTSEKLFFPQEIASMILTKLKMVAEEYLGRKVTDAVITVPAYFTMAQKRATEEAATIAGLNVIRVLNESVAVALAWSLKDKNRLKVNDNANGGNNNGSHGQEDVRYLVTVDLGSGGLSVAVIVVEEGFLEVKSVGGDSGVGGDDFDSRLISYAVREGRKMLAENTNQANLNRSALKNESEATKCRLSASRKTSFQIETLEGTKLQIPLTRAHFEHMNADLFLRIRQTLTKCLKDAKIQPNMIHEVVLLGKSSRIPKVQQIVQEIFCGKELNQSLGVEGVEAVAVGAAIQAAILSGARNSELDKMICLDALPFSLGIETKGQKFTPVIPRGTTIPYKATKNFYFQNHQESEGNLPNDSERKGVAISIFEGDEPLTKDNEMIGDLVIPLLIPLSAAAAVPSQSQPAAETGEQVSSPKLRKISTSDEHAATATAETTTTNKGPTIEVTFDVDANMKLQVAAMVVNPGQGRQVGRKNRSRKRKLMDAEEGGLSHVEVRKLMEKGEAYGAEEKEEEARQEEAERLERYCWTTKSKLQTPQFVNSVSPLKRKRMMLKCKAVLDWLEIHQADAQKAEFEEERNELHRFCEPIFAAAAAGVADDSRTHSTSTTE